MGRRRRHRGKHRKDQPTFEGRPSASVESVEVEDQKTRMQLFAFGPDSFHEEELHDIRRLPEMFGKFPVLWLNVDSLSNADLIGTIGDLFGFHRLAMEDVLNLNQRAKIENYEQYYYIVMRMAALDDHLMTEQLSMFLGVDFVVTFQHREGDCFQPVRQRIREGRGRVRHGGPDYLMYLLVDAVIDSYFPILEEFGEKLDYLEEESFASPTPSTLARIHDVKRDLLTLRRVAWPLREAMNVVLREPTPLVCEPTKVYLRDCYDHVVRVIDLVETYRELGSDLADIYLSSLSMHMNEVMKVLTIISTIFIPLTFIVGVYGMNFDPKTSPYNMPEIEWYWGYPFVLGLMFVVAIAMVYFFWRKGWIRSLLPGDALKHGEENNEECPS